MLTATGRSMLVVLASVGIVASTCSPAGRAPATWDGMPAGYTETGDLSLGPADAPVTLEEWSDYLCPFCGRHFRQTYPQILDAYVRTGKVRLVFRDLPLSSLHPTAIRGHIAARCAATQGAAEFWAMHDEIFRRQAEWNRLPDPGDFLAGIARGLDLDMQAWQTCVADPATRAAVGQSVSQARALGLHGTPSFRIFGPTDEPPYTFSGARPYVFFAQQLDARLAGDSR
jgi:protein-disulfide isomerase